MTKREVVRLVLDGKRPPYVPWDFGFTREAREKLVAHYGTEDLELILHNHLLGLGSGIGYFDDAGNDRVRDVFTTMLQGELDVDVFNAPNKTAASALADIVPQLNALLAAR